MAIQDVITMLRNRFKELNLESKEEKAMAAREQNCGKYGHKRENCRTKDNKKPNVIQPRSGNCSRNGGGGGGRNRSICGYCNKQGHHENECFQKKSDAERAHVAEEENDNDKSESSKEHVMMAFENRDYMSDSSDEEYIDFESEKELFDLFNPKILAESNPKRKSKKKQNKKEYVPFKVFDENGNRNWIKFL